MRKSGTSLLCFLFALNLASNAHAALLVPQQVGGDVGYSYLQHQSSNNYNSSSNQISASINGKAYFWQPWFITSTAKLNFAQEYAQSNTTSSESNFITGTLGINVLPISRFPFSAQYSVSDSRVDSHSDNSSTLITSDSSRHFTRRQLNLTQGYQGKRYRVNLRYGNSETENILSEKSNNETYSLDYNLRLPKQDLSATLLQSNQSNNYTANEGENTVVRLSHRYYPSSSLSVDSLASQVKTINSFATTPPSGSTQQMTTDINQVSSNINWRSKAQPLSINGGVRVHQLEYQTDNTTAASNDGVYSNIAASYQITNNLRSSAAAHYSTSSNNTTTQDAHGESMGIYYSSDAHKVASFDYNWNSNISVSQQTTEEEDTNSAGFSLGHRGSRNWKLKRNSNIRLSLNQKYQLNSDNTSKTDNQHLTQSLNLGWTLSEGAARNIVQLTITDSRGMSDDRSFSQMLNFQASRQQTLSRNSSLNGNVNYQMTHNYVEGTPDYGTGNRLTASVGYLLTRPFSLQNISFRSDLRAHDSDPANGSRTSDIMWDNRFTHSIGKVTSTLKLYLHEQHDTQSTTLSLNIRRVF